MLGGQRIQSGAITLPYYGMVAADILLASTATVPPQTTLVVGNLTLQVAVIRQAGFAGARSFRVVGGYGGWRKIVPPRFYSSPASLPLTTVLSDVAVEVGEKVSVPATRLLGTQFARSAGKASRVLEQLCPDWWVAPDGVTHVGARPSGSIGTPATVISYSGGKGQFQVATEDMSSWLPGRVFTSATVTTPTTIGTTSIQMGNDGKVRMEILSTDATGSADRLNDSLDEIIESRTPNLAYYAVWKCTIVAVHGSGPWTIDVVPTDPACPLPGMTTLTYWPSIAGARVQPPDDGSATCLVGFINGSPQQPYVHSFDSTTPIEIEIGAGDDVLPLGNPLGRGMRWGDTFQIIVGPPYTPLPMLTNTPYVLAPGVTPPMPFSRVKL